MQIDGVLDEKSWQVSEKAENFVRVTPVDTGFAIAQTTVVITYDKSNIYVGAVCYDPLPGKRPVESLRRDFEFNKNDNFRLHIDTYNNLTNGFAFSLSAAGAQSEGVINNGNQSSFTWDTKWKSAVKSHDDRWVLEMAIPFRSLRYYGGEKEWGVNFGRLDLKTNEKSAWAPVPRQFPHNSLPHAGTLVWDKPLDKAGLRLSFIPYATATVLKNSEAGEPAKWKWNAGFDTKMILSTSLNLDLTVNPDYSQVEEDRQQTNLDRFELFYPERRQFFLENSDLFANLGNSQARPFFSRRIGLNVPVNFGGRLTGRIGNKWRIGMMDMQTGSKGENLSSNYAVAVLQREILSRSSIVGFLVNKEITRSYNDTAFTGYRYNRVAGLEYNFASADNRWQGKTFYHQSFYTGAGMSAAAVSGNIGYYSQFLKATINQSWIGSDFVAEAGYIRRTGFYEITPSVSYLFYPSGSKRILSHGPDASFNAIFDPEFNLTDRETEFSYIIGWQNKSQLSLSIEEQFVKLSRAFDPTNTGGVKLAAGEQFNWKSVRAGFSSDARKLFNYILNAGIGGYYNGNRWNINGLMNYRVQPYGSIGMTVSYNNISLPEPYNSAKLILAGPTLDITFTDKIFLTTFVQYNNQVDNLNMNIRFQWRFAPVSDLFIVYTGNSYTENFMNKNRGLVIKLSYWFN
ncbi:MAG: carbohydrate binding family 9 domain-containing protein [Bacteroidales bacterium]|nr:carbohydrate binding family 9 domain-containing protein [Bacteroidales bacterium]